VGIRDEQRQRQIERIKRVATELLAEHGTEGVVLREVARVMGQTSSALYRYFANRDQLLTALIMDAYNELGAYVEAAERKIARDDLEGRFAAAARAIRRWALRHPHQYGLIFGTPIPNYEAPEETISAAVRVAAVLATIFASVPTEDLIARRNDLRDSDLEAGVTLLLPEFTPAQRGRGLLAWSSIFGLVSFELFGHFKGSVHSTANFFDVSIRELWSSLIHR
jgi:AcrR family transcriptional regulator